MHNHFGHYFRVLHWCTDQMMTDSLSKIGLTSAQGHIMCFLLHQPAPPCPRDVEEALQLSHPTVSGILSRLEEKVFIEIRPDPEDRRCKRIYVLPRGQEFASLMHQNIQTIETRIVDGFSEAEQQQFIRLLNRAIANMGGVPPNPIFKEEPK